MSYCDTCCHQYSDICGGCETLEGVPIKYSGKEIDKAAEAVIEKIARKLSNDILFGMNRKETNADRIRTMTDEELAKTISGEEIYPWCAEEEPCKYDSCTDCVLAWLKKEAGT